MPRTWWILLLFVVLLSGDVLLGGAVSWWRYGLNASVLVIIACTITLGLRFGLLIGLLAGLLFGLTSVLNPIAHTVSFLLASMTVWFVSHRIVTSRSTVSFLTAIMAATGVYGVSLIGCDALVNVIIRQPVRVPLENVALATSIQLFVHPLLLITLWRLIGRNRYHQLTSTYSQTF